MIYMGKLGGSDGWLPLAAKPTAESISVWHIDRHHMSSMFPQGCLFYEKIRNISGCVLKQNICVAGDILYLGSNNKLLMKNVGE